jgi:predicted nuclease of predicted toxin-antitoxin system
VGEIGVSKAADEEILAFSLRKKALVVTLDADFHAILAVSEAQGPSVIRVRLQGLGAPDMVEVVRKILINFEQRLKGGSLITVKAVKTTCHRLLPMGRLSARPQASALEPAESHVASPMGRDQRPWSQCGTATSLQRWTGRRTRIFKR